jgi:ABC-type arginine transport system permease subunit
MEEHVTHGITSAWEDIWSNKNIRARQRYYVIAVAAVDEMVLTMYVDFCKYQQLDTGGEVAAAAVASAQSVGNRVNEMKTIIDFLCSIQCVGKGASQYLTQEDEFMPLAKQVSL